MGIQPISFKAWVTADKETIQKDHERLNKVANMYTTGSVQDDAFIKRAHDVIDITPWSCSEGACLKNEDLDKSDKFVDTMLKNFKNGNKKLAYALGRMVELTRAGRANNGDFPDLPLGKIQGLRTIIVDESLDLNDHSPMAVAKPEYAEVKETMDNIIYHNNPF